MTETRIEVTFNNGRFVAFPNVVKESVQTKDNFMKFTYGTHGYQAYVNYDQVNFFEIMELER